MARWIGILSSLVAFLAFIVFVSSDITSSATGLVASLVAFCSQALAQIGQGVDDVDQTRLQEVTPADEWNVIEHLGGNSPWMAKRHGVVDESLEPPDGCYIDQVHMVSMDRTFDSGSTDQ